MYRDDVPVVAPSLIRWGAVFAGAVVGLATLILLSALWFALGFASGVEDIRTNIEWYVGLSAVGALLLGGYIAGLLSSTRGLAAGLWHGVTLWGLVLIASLAIGIPGFLGFANVDQLTQGGAVDAPAQATWATFWALLIGLGAAAIGGMLGGLTPRATAAMGPAVAPAYGYGGDRTRTYEHDRPTEMRRHGPEHHDQMTVEELRAHAHEQGIEDTDDMSRDELLRTLARREAA